MKKNSEKKQTFNSYAQWELKNLHKKYHKNLLQLNVELGELVGLVTKYSHNIEN